MQRRRRVSTSVRMCVRSGAVLVVVVVLLPLIVACDSRQAQALDPPAHAAATSLVWQPLGTWFGRGGRQTESFDITTGSLRLTWEALAESDPDAPGTGRFRVALHSAISGRPLQTIVDTIGAGTDTARVGAEPRVAYLRIESKQIDWRVTLEEGVPGNGLLP